MFLSAGSRARPEREVPRGAVMLFYNATAPVGWTKITTQNDKALRVVSGTTGGTAGGTNAFSTVFAQTVTGGHALSQAELASHVHGIFGDSGLAASTIVASCPSTRMEVHASLNGTSGSAGSGSAHTHTITMSIQFIDLILAVKN